MTADAASASLLGGMVGEVTMAKQALKAKQRRSRLATLRKRDGDNCWICEKPMVFGRPNLAMSASVDHVIELRNGGTNARDNLKLAHKICNTMRDRGGFSRVLAKRAARDPRLAAPMRDGGWGVSK